MRPLALALLMLAGCGARSGLAIEHRDAGPCEPSAEQCNGADDDCDGFVDESFDTVSCGMGACAVEESVCRDGAIRACEPSPPSAETCNGIDDDCNGVIDDIDRGRDGIPDCARIGILGNPGSRPASDFAGWLQQNGASAERVLTMGEMLTPELLARFDVVIVDWLTRDYSAAEAQTLFDWVSAGGGLMTMTGYNNTPSDLSRPDSLLRPFGIGYIAPLIEGSAVTDFLVHPTTEGLTSVTFLGGYAVLALPDAPGPPTITARLNGAPVAVAQEVGRGRVYAWGDEWVEFDSEWHAMPMIQLFWANIVGWLSRLR